MIHKPENDRMAGTLLQQLATALVNYAVDERGLKTMCRGLWPDCGFYRGNTHLRVLVNGESNGTSFYVEL